MTPVEAISIRFGSSQIRWSTPKYLLWGYDHTNDWEAYGCRELLWGFPPTLHGVTASCHFSSWRPSKPSGLPQEQFRQPRTQRLAYQEFFHRPPEACGRRRKSVRYLTYLGAKWVQWNTCSEKLYPKAISSKYEYNISCWLLFSPSPIANVKKIVSGCLLLWQGMQNVIFILLSVDHYVERNRGGRCLYIGIILMIKYTLRSSCEWCELMWIH